MTLLENPFIVVKRERVEWLVCNAFCFHYNANEFLIYFAHLLFQIKFHLKCRKDSAHAVCSDKQMHKHLRPHIDCN